MEKEENLLEEASLEEISGGTKIAELPGIRTNSWYSKEEEIGSTIVKVNSIMEYEERCFVLADIYEVIDRDAKKCRYVRMSPMNASYFLQEYPYEIEWPD